MLHPRSSNVEADDEIEIIYEGKASAPGSAALPCSFCNLDLTQLDIIARQDHYERHLADFQDVSAPSSRHAYRSVSPAHVPTAETRDERMKFRFSRDTGKHQEDVFWYPSLQTQPPLNYTPGLIPILRRALISSHEKGYTQRAVLCYDRSVHIYHDTFDRKWGCGYRNYMMACAALVDQRFQDAYFALFDSFKPPGVRSLQLLIEEAWAKGYDEEGATQLKRHLHGTDKWIGTAELYVAFTYIGIPAQLADFILPRRPGIQPISRDTKPLLDWIKEYFSPSEQHKHSSVQDAWKSASAVTLTNRLPFVLQHNGHSRTVIGYEIDKKGQMMLLTFDPSVRMPADLREAAIGQLSRNGSRSKTSKLIETIKHPLNAGKRIHSLEHADEERAKRVRVDTPEIIEVDSDGEITNGADLRPTGGRETLGARSSASPQKGKMKEKSTTQAVLPTDAIKVFRLDSRKLAMHEKYQVLWFPLEAPLTEQRKRAQRVVTSERIC